MRDQYCSDHFFESEPKIIYSLSLSFISFVVLLVTILFLGEFENGFVGRYKQPFKPILPKENAAWEEMKVCHS